jgi:hypothetical protein
MPESEINVTQVSQTFILREKKIFEKTGIRGGWGGQMRFPFPREFFFPPVPLGNKFVYEYRGIDLRQTAGQACMRAQAANYI